MEAAVIGSRTPLVFCVALYLLVRTLFISNAFFAPRTGDPSPLLAAKFFGAATPPRAPPAAPSRCNPRKFLSYRSSQWEQVWLSNIGRWQHGEICSQMAAQDASVRTLLAGLCAGTVPGTPWCVLDDSAQRTWWHTAEGRASRERPADVSPAQERALVLGPARPTDRGVFSGLRFVDECTGEEFEELIEPLVSHLRHPLAGCGGWSGGDSLARRGWTAWLPVGLEAAGVAGAAWVAWSVHAARSGAATLPRQERTRTGKGRKGRTLAIAGGLVVLALALRFSWGFGLATLVGTLAVVPEFIVDRTYMLPPPPTRVRGADSTAAKEAAEERSPTKAFYFDAGASSWSAGAGGPSLSFFTNVWARHGIAFDHIEAWEGGTTPAAFQASVPAEFKSRVVFHQEWISSNPGTRPFIPTIIRQTTNVQDYVLFKLDIDSATVETGTVMHLLSPEGAADLAHIDEFVWEHHVTNYIMEKWWGAHGVDPTFDIADSYQFFLELRRRGVRAHSYV